MSDGEEALLRQLAEALRAALKDAVANARREFSGEHFYGYILYTLPCLDYAVLLVNTEEGLVRITPDSRQQDALRWSPSDWDCNEDIEESFKGVNAILGSLVRIQDQGEGQFGKRWKVFIDVLKQLDAEGIFGISTEREAAVVNIMWGDQDIRAHVESARELNPTVSYLKYARYILPSLLTTAKEIERSRSVYKDDVLALIQSTIAQVEGDLSTDASH